MLLRLRPAEAAHSGERRVRRRARVRRLHEQLRQVVFEEGSALVKPAADEKLVRLTFHKDCVGEHVISTVSREFGVDINIVLANVEVIEDNPLGGMVALLGGGEKQVAAALHYLNENHVYTEVIADGSI